MARTGSFTTHEDILGIDFKQGRPFRIVEYLPGGTLEDRLRDGPIPPLEAVSVVDRLADALGEWHDKGLPHGDIRPGNIGFTSNGSPKLLDSDLARETDDAVAAPNASHYLSSEVLSGQPADPADDVWSLCVVLYEMVAGRHPFAATGIDETAERIRHQRLVGAEESATGSKTGSAVIDFVTSILTVPRPARPSDARAFAEALPRPSEGE